LFKFSSTVSKKKDQREREREEDECVCCNVSTSEEVREPQVRGSA
jgi:hypothetical protein